MKKNNLLLGIMIVATMAAHAQTPTFNTLGIGIATPQGTLHVHTTEGYYNDQPATPDNRENNYPYDYYQTLFRISNTTTGTATTDGFVIDQTNQTITLRQYENAPLYLKGYNNLGLSLLPNGNVGIGTDSPEAPLHVNGNANVSNSLTVKNLSVNESVNSPLRIKKNVSICTNDIPLSIGNAHSSALGWGSAYIGFNAERTTEGLWTRKGGTTHNGGAVIWATMAGDLLFANLPSTGGNNVTGIEDGQISSSVNMKLSTEGLLTVKEVKVTLEGWPDYVFSEGFPLPTLSETEAYIKKNGHLQGIPSAAEVEENGLSMGEMNRLLLQKVEELTLHLINLQKQIDELKTNQQNK